MGTIRISRVCGRAVALGRGRAVSPASATRIAEDVRSGATSAEAVVRDCLDRLADGSELDAVITVCADAALARARTNPRGRLAGVPLLVKDLFDTAGIRTTYASAIYADHVPERTAPAVAALEAEGAIVVAKANADEFAWGVAGGNVHHGDVVNPTHPGRIAGGSSGGNAAALAAGLVPLALGTDTGGSVRLPAAACEVVGLKPALGAITTEGVHPLAASFDTVGPMARTVADCALAHAILTRTVIPAPRLAGLRVGVLARPPDVTGAAQEAGRDPRAAGIADELRALGAEVTEVVLPVPGHDTWPVFYAGAARAHARTYPLRAADYGPGVRTKLELAHEMDPEDVRRAGAALAAWRTRALHEPAVDLVASPVLGGPELPAAGVDELVIRLAFSTYTRAFSYLGWPAVALGDVQLAGRDAPTVLGAALALERAKNDSR